jgi:hypothetical protein
MAEHKPGVQCSGCLDRLIENPSMPARERKPCPKCGSLNRTFGISLSDGIALHEWLRAKTRRKGRSRPSTEILVGDSFTVRAQSWSHREQVIDRDNDRYRERVTDKEGHIIHEADASLSGHQGHGVAKRKAK